MNHPEIASPFLEENLSSAERLSQDPPLPRRSFALTPKARKILKLGFLVLGVTLFSVLIIRLHPRLLWENLRAFGFNFIFILLVSFAQIVTNTLAWEIFLKNLTKRVRFLDILKIKLAGEAISNLTPLSWVGGDPVRIVLLVKHIPLTEGTASVVVDRTLNGLAVAFFMLVGIVMAFIKLTLPWGLEIGLLATLAVMLGLSSFFYFHSHEGLFEFFIDFSKKLRIKRSFSEKTVAHAKEIDGYISRFYKMNKRGFFLAFALHFVGKSIGVVEIYLAALLLNYPISFLDAYLLLSVTVLINTLFAFVPGSLGVLEGAYAGTFALVQLNPVMGTSIQIIRRIRTLFWTAVGFAFLSRMKKQITPRPTSPNPPASPETSISPANIPG